MKINPDKYAVSDAVKKLNPDVFGGVDTVPAVVTKQDPAPALVGSAPKRKAIKRVVAPRGLIPRRPRARSRSETILVTLTAYRRKLIDSDNHVASLKHLRDAVAEWLGIDDGSPMIDWEYHQLKTSGAPGVAVKIECP